MSTKFQIHLNYLGVFQSICTVCEIKQSITWKETSFKYYHLKCRITLGDDMKFERDERKFDFHDIGLGIKRKREAKGITQEQLAYIIFRARLALLCQQTQVGPRLYTFHKPFHFWNFCKVITDDFSKIFPSSAMPARWNSTRPFCWHLPPWQCPSGSCQEWSERKLALPVCLADWRLLQGAPAW